MKKAAVIGFPIIHSWSPKIHNFWLNEYHIRGSYDKVELKPDDLAKFILDLKKNHYCGLNITIPHKESASKLCDKLTKNAKILGAVNLLTVKNGLLEGRNTDGEGFVESLKESFPNIKLSNSSIAIIGAGGAAKSIAYALDKFSPKKIIFFNRNIKRAENFIKSAGIRASALELKDINNHQNGFTILINATSVGMLGTKGDLKIDFKKYRGLDVFADIVYNPYKTKNIIAAKKLGIKTLGGMGMLLYQAVPAFEAFYGKKPIVTESLKNYMKKFMR
tara:strand:+ start:23455 stop:24282 length:828 start_codon:yes stop_codon:yes gene_type:complete